MNGCYATKETSFRDDEIEITKIELSDSTIIDFSNYVNGVGYISDNNIVAFKNDSTMVRYPNFTITKMYTEEMNVTKTVLTIVGTFVLTALIGGVILGITTANEQDKYHRELKKDNE